MLIEILEMGLILGIDKKKKEEKIDLGDIDEKVLLSGSGSQKQVVKVAEGGDDMPPFMDGDNDDAPPFGGGGGDGDDVPPFMAGEDEEDSPFGGGPEEDDAPPFGASDEGDSPFPGEPEADDAPSFGASDEGDSPFGGGPEADDAPPFGASDEGDLPLGAGRGGVSNEKVASLEEKVNQVDSVLANMRRSNDEIEEKIGKIEKSMEGILSVYELVTNEINPFVEKESDKKAAQAAVAPQAPIQQETPKPVEIPKEEKKIEPAITEELKEEKVSKAITEEVVKEEKSETPQPQHQPQYQTPQQPLEQQKPIMDVPPMQELPRHQAGLAGVSLGEEKIYLDKIKTDPASLLLMLKWLDFLIMKTGYRGMIKALLYYEDIGWISDDVRNEMIRYSNDVSMEESPSNISRKLSIRDHIVSLFFVAKLQGIKISPSLYSAVVDELEDLGLLQ